MNSSTIENLVHQSFDEFYRQRLMKLTGVTLSDLLRKKNLYLLCVTNGSSVSKIVEKTLEAYISSSDENIFGQTFLESITSIEREDTALPDEKSNSAYAAIAFIKIIRYAPTQSRIEFDKEYANALTRLSYDFLNNFGNADGSIDWEKLLRYNSGKDNVPWVSKVIPVIAEDQEDESNEEDSSYDDNESYA